MAKRILGQDTVITFMLNGQAVASLDDVKSFDFTPMFEIKQEGYVGEKTDRYDEVFKGASGRAELHFESAAVFNFVQSILDRAQRRLPGTSVNVKTTLNFPNGDRPLVILTDVFFGDMPFKVSKRDEYVDLSLDYKCSNITFQRIPNAA